MYDMHFQMVFIPPAGDAVQEESAEQQENAWQTAQVTIH
jgi:hypothetical protein